MIKCPHCGEEIAAPAAGLTPRQLQLFCFIANYTEDHGYSPTYREMAAHCHIAGLGVIKGLIDQLERRGHITRIKNASRSISLVAA